MVSDTKSTDNTGDSSALSDLSKECPILVFNIDCTEQDLTSGSVPNNEQLESIRAELARKVDAVSAFKTSALSKSCPKGTRLH